MNKGVAEGRHAGGEEASGRTAPPRRAMTDLPAGLDPKWAWHYRQLVLLRQRLAQDTSAKLHEAAEPLEPHSMHAGDSGTDEFEHDVALTLLAAEQNSLNDVNDAIARIEHGTYGFCEATHARIPAARLRALPWCRYVREVEERLERTGAVTRTRLPRVASLRGVQPEIPTGGDLPREGTEAEEADEPEETTSAKIIREKGATKED